MDRYHLLLLPLLACLTMGLGYGVLSLPDQAEGLQKIVAGKMEVSGVSNPVTAVLLNFRGYDTLLEMVVLFLALLGSQLPIERPAKGVDEQGSKILSTSCGQAGTRVAPPQLTGQKRQPSHIQTFSLDRAVHPPTQISLGLQVDAALEGHDCCINLKTAIR